MLTLDPAKIATLNVPLSTSWLLGSCMELRGKQDLWVAQKPEVLEVLRERAIIHSVESSNRIEGVTVERERLRPVVLQRSKPRDRSEEELAGYRRALDWIFSRKHPVPIEPATLLRLHAYTQGGMCGDAGQFKAHNNEIIEILPGGDRKIRFTPTAAKETPSEIERLCRNYQQACRDQQIPPLLIIATFVFDMLCIHPFRDGNGRVSRLLTTLLLETHGFQVARYVSLERVVEERKSDYYLILHQCSSRWHQGKNEILPWWNLFLAVLREAYQEWDRHVVEAAARPAKTDLLRRGILDQIGEFTLADVCAQHPSVSPQLAKRVLTELKDGGKVRLTGRGRGARWIRTRTASPRAAARYNK
ncbi:MAG: Fic family protein [Acidobacteria bacterium]|nr:Fic family protein [Acidobacteriota bacterium]